MSYNVSAFYVAETFIKNRLDALLKPIVRNLSGGNAPLIKSNDRLPPCLMAASRSIRVSMMTVARRRPSSLICHDELEKKRCALL